MEMFLFVSFFPGFCFRVFFPNNGAVYSLMQ